MKNLLKAIACAVVVSTCYNCSIDSIVNSQDELDANADLLDVCNGENPVARLTNNGDVNFDIGIYTTDGVMLNQEYDITPGSASSWMTFLPGETLISIKNDTYQEEKVIYTINTCMEFDMEIGVDNKLTSAVPVPL